MHNRRIIQLIIVLGVFLTGCASLGDNFFIRNYEDQAVNIKYIYYTSDNITESKKFRYQPKSYVLISDTLLKKKVIRQFPYKSDLHFDSLNVQMIDSISYQFDMPAKSTIRIAPIYYGDNIEYIIINNTDTIKFIPDYPMIENEELDYQGSFNYKPRLVGDSYYILNVETKKISRILSE